MNYQEIKTLLAEKDLEIKLRTERTYEYFDLIKEEVIDYLIKKHIEDEFSGKYHFFTGDNLAKIFYEKLGFNTTFFRWSYWNTDIEKIEYFSYLPDTDFHDIFEKTGQGDDFIKNVKKHYTLEGTYDFKLLGSLVINHVKRSGFEQRVVTSRSTGRKTNLLAFRITRSALENNCCESKEGVVFKGNHAEDAPSKEVAIVGVVAIAVLIIIALLFIFN